MGIAVPAAVLVLWELCARLAIISPQYFPPPTTVAWTLVDRLFAGDLGTDLLVTLTRLGFAFALAAVPAVPLGLLMGMARPVRDLVEPYIAFILPVPKIAVQTMDPRLIEVGRNYGAHGARLFWKVILPAALPAIFTGLRLGLGLSLVTLVAVEFVAAKSGLGHLVYRHWQMLSTPEMYAAFALVGALGLALTRGLRVLQARVLSWQEDIGV
jgi:NitT/TauT family transport system permease protein